MIGQTINNKELDAAVLGIISAFKVIHQGIDIICSIVYRDYTEGTSSVVTSSWLPKPPSLEGEAAVVLAVIAAMDLRERLNSHSNPMLSNFAMRSAFMFVGFDSKYILYCLLWHLTHDESWFPWKLVKALEMLQVPYLLAYSFSSLYRSNQPAPWESQTKPIRSRALIRSIVIVLDFASTLSLYWYLWRLTHRAWSIERMQWR